MTQEQQNESSSDFNADFYISKCKTLIDLCTEKMESICLITVAMNAYKKVDSKNIDLSDLNIRILDSITDGWKNPVQFCEKTTKKITGDCDPLCEMICAISLILHQSMETIQRIKEKLQSDEDITLSSLIVTEASVLKISWCEMELNRISPI